MYLHVANMKTPHHVASRPLDRICAAPTINSTLCPRPKRLPHFEQQPETLAKSAESAVSDDRSISRSKTPVRGRIEQIDASERRRLRGITPAHIHAIRRPAARSAVRILRKFVAYGFS